MDIIDRNLIDIIDDLHTFSLNISSNLDISNSTWAKTRVTKLLQTMKLLLVKKEIVSILDNKLPDEIIRIISSYI